jgi:hypothetical protein
MMGLISGAVLHHGGSVTAVIPAAMVRAGGEGESRTGGHISLEEEGREKVSMTRIKARNVYISDLRKSDLIKGRICEGPRFFCFVDRPT